MKTTLAARWTLLAALRARARRHHGGSLWRLREELWEDQAGAGLLGSAAAIQHRITRSPTRLGRLLDRQQIKEEHLRELLCWANEEPFEGRPAFARLY